MRRSTIRTLALAAGLTGLAAVAVRLRWRSPPPAVPDLDLERYCGTWYEIARLPLAAEHGCWGPTATYHLAGPGRLHVVERCRAGSILGPVREVRGEATVIRPDTPGCLRLHFHGRSAGDFRVLAIDPPYSWALVGTSDRRHLWILSRTPAMPDDRYFDLLERARALGFDVRRLIRTPQEATGAAGANVVHDGGTPSA